MFIHTLKQNFNIFFKAYQKIAIPKIVQNMLFNSIFDDIILTSEHWFAKKNILNTYFSNHKQVPKLIKKFYWIGFHRVKNAASIYAYFS